MRGIKINENYNFLARTQKKIIWETTKTNKSALPSIFISNNFFSLKFYKNITCISIYKNKIY